MYPHVSAEMEFRTDDGDVIQAILQDALIKKFLDQYPELVLVDVIFKLTNLRMPLDVKLAIDSNGEIEFINYRL